MATIKQTIGKNIWKLIGNILQIIPNKTADADAETESRCTLPTFLLHLRFIYSDKLVIMVRGRSLRLTC